MKSTRSVPDLIKAMSAPQSSSMQRAVVYETLDNLYLRESTEPGSDLELWHSELKRNLLNKEDLDIAPRGSIIVKVISAGRGKNEKNLRVCFPMFSSHLSLPIKAGEQVWIMLEDPTATRGYWVSRIHEPVFVEDANYTHGDRRYSHTSPSTNFTISEEDNSPKPLTSIPTFQNGRNVELDNPDMLTIGDPTEYEVIYKSSIESKQFVIEPVPRFTKRPGDLVLQGSHNAAIVLGTNRGYTGSDDIDRKKSNAELKDKIGQGKGSIDLVVGRGRIHVPLDKLDGKDKRDKEPARTEPRVIKTSTEYIKGAREVFETDKNISLVDDKKFSNTATDACEGDPDFVNDATRIYATMKSSPDKEFSLRYPKCPAVGETNEGVDIAPVEDSAALVFKSDEVRIVARQVGLENQAKAEPTGDNKPAPIAGSIKIIKEGILDDEGGKGQASIIMQKDGSIMIDGPKIVLGSGLVKDNGEGTQVSLGVGATEPVVLGNMLVAKLEAFMDSVTAALQFSATHIHPTGTGPSGPPTAELYSAKKSEIETTKGELKEVLSKLAKTL